MRCRDAAAAPEECLSREYLCSGDQDTLHRPGDEASTQGPGRPTVRPLIQTHVPCIAGAGGPSSLQDMGATHPAVALAPAPKQEWGHCQQPRLLPRRDGGLHLRPSLALQNWWAMAVACTGELDGFFVRESERTGHTHSSPKPPGAIPIHPQDSAKPSPGPTPSRRNPAETHGPPVAQPMRSRGQAEAKLGSLSGEQAKAQQSLSQG